MRRYKLILCVPTQLYQELEDKSTFLCHQINIVEDLKEGGHWAKSTKNPPPPPPFYNNLSLTLWSYRKKKS